MMAEAKSPNMTTKFKRLYKVVSPGAPGSVPWKEVYRKRCYERLLDSRQSLLEKFRYQDVDSSSSSSRTVAIQDLVLTEWKAFTRDINTASKSADSLTCKDEEDGDVDVECIDSDNDSVLTVLEEITEELLKEEQQIFSEYEARNKLDDEALCASIKCLTTAEVICPVCQKSCKRQCKANVTTTKYFCFFTNATRSKRSQLFINKGVVFCHCGVLIDTEQDCITIEMIETNLHSGIELHSSCCQESPSFSTVNHPGITNLLMTCAACDFMYIVV